ncbi:MAG: hypothetical protein ACM3ZC_09740 [Bacteroidota bacterium]
MGDGKSNVGNAFELLLSLIVGDKLGAKVGPPGAEVERTKKVKEAILFALEVRRRVKRLCKKDKKDFVTVRCLDLMARRRNCVHACSYSIWTAR